jgi:hypothetical protein
MDELPRDDIAIGIPAPSTNPVLPTLPVNPIDPTNP